ncbi:hypothetical protein QYM36_017082 [Artemia franciscana]|uniref:C-type lectin domain-containing protein n=1 Tax=Artemia franciscana TaxID=6661 RepID=A0AA88H799_ARTSF|nr:hypothetical protein QYM36_017082 [Artemia franciscana]
MLFNSKIMVKLLSLFFAISTVICEPLDEKCNDYNQKIVCQDKNLCLCFTYEDTKKSLPEALKVCRSKRGGGLAVIDEDLFEKLSPWLREVQRGQEKFYLHLWGFSGGWCDLPNDFSASDMGFYAFRCKQGYMKGDVESPFLCQKHFPVEFNALKKWKWKVEKNVKELCSTDCPRIIETLYFNIFDYLESEIQNILTETRLTLCQLLLLKERIDNIQTMYEGLNYQIRTIKEEGYLKQIIELKKDLIREIQGMYGKCIPYIQSMPSKSVMEFYQQSDFWNLSEMLKQNLVRSLQIIETAKRVLPETLQESENAKNARIIKFLIIYHILLIIIICFIFYIIYPCFTRSREILTCRKAQRPEVISEV